MKHFLIEFMGVSMGGGKGPRLNTYSKVNFEKSLNFAIAYQITLADVLSKYSIHMSYQRTEYFLVITCDL